MENANALLDLFISLQHQHNILRASFQVHRKNTFSGVSIHQNSPHFNVHKHAPVNSPIHRLISLPLSPEAKEEKIIEVEKIVKINKLELSVRLMIERRLLKKLLRTANFDSSPPPTVNPDRRKWIRLPYVGRSSEKMVFLLQRVDYRGGFYPVTTIGSLGLFLPTEPIH